MKTAPKDAHTTHIIALQFITFLASDETRMERFLAHSGMTLGDLRDHAQDPVFLGFMLDYALQDESLMLAFTSVENITPQALVNARHKLPGSSHDL